jgi:uncharacterized protein YrrD
MLRLGGLRVLNERGRRLGIVDDVVFAPDSLTALGFEVEPRAFLFLFRRKRRMLAFDAVEYGRTDEGREVLHVRDSKSAWGSRAARRLGVDWEQTVIWLGMPVKTESGEDLGTVRDALIDVDSGELAALGISGGVVKDMAAGVRDIDASEVRGFDGTFVRVADSVAELELSGGAAAGAGRATAKATKVARDAGGAAVRVGKAAATKAEKHPAGRKAVGWLRSIGNEVRDAMGDPDEDK